MKFKVLEIVGGVVVLAISALLISMSYYGDDEIQASEWLAQSKSLKSSTVLLNNSKNILPLNDLERRKIAAVNVGAVFGKEFNGALEKYSQISSFSLVNTNLQLSVDTLTARLKFFNTVIIQTATLPLKDVPFQNFVKELTKTKEVVLVAYGKSANLQFFDKSDFPIIWTDINSPAAAVYTAQAIFGGIAISAKLPETISPSFKNGTGFSTAVARLKYTIPEEVGIESKDLEKPIDKIVEEAIAQKATPGAVVMVVKDGKVIFNKGYGNHTYKKEVPTKASDIFDLASITKIGATTMAAMRLYEQHKLKLDTNIGAYVPLVRNTDKNNLTVKELLLHQAGLIPFIPFYESINHGDYSRDSSLFHTLKVADNYYLRANYFEEVMWPRMLNSRLSVRGKHVYSDLSMYIMKDIIEHIIMERLDKYVSNQFYSPLGMYTAGFNPRERFSKTKIVPTEQDAYFRKTLLEGYVHDQGAAMAGGVSGHAGLFSSANDLAILFQMILNGGTYGGKEYFKPETIKLFTSKYSNVSRRGLGFDRWDPDRTNRYPSDLASDKTYGHTGYTGTCVWVDPEYDLIYIFLSNRVHPTVTGKLSSLRIRPRIQDVIYKAIKESK
ncbi:MAG TPA: serine hydrolase [Pedobacter sp.]|jgi:CubicO group peptidase (beta-lactamase class C family)